MNGYFNGVTAVASYFIVGPMSECFGRRKALILTFFIGGLACAVYYPLSSLGLAWAYVCVVLGSFGATSAFNLIYLVTAEAFPTEY